MTDVSPNEVPALFTWEIGAHSRVSNKVAKTTFISFTICAKLYSAVAHK